MIELLQSPSSESLEIFDPSPIYSCRQKTVIGRYILVLFGRVIATTELSSRSHQSTVFFSAMRYVQVAPVQFEDRVAVVVFVYPEIVTC